MSAHALLTKLEAAGVHLARDGHDVIAEVQPGVNLGPYRDRILANKLALLSILGGDVQLTASTLIWRHIYQGPVEATAPPPGWDGTL